MNMRPPGTEPGLVPRSSSSVCPRIRSWICCCTGPWNGPWTSPWIRPCESPIKILLWKSGGKWVIQCGQRRDDSPSVDLTRDACGTGCILTS